MYYPERYVTAHIIKLHKLGACVSDIAILLNKPKIVVIDRLKKSGFKPREKPIKDKSEWMFKRAGSPRYD